MYSNMTGKRRPAPGEEGVFYRFMNHRVSIDMTLPMFILCIIAMFASFYYIAPILFPSESSMVEHQIKAHTEAFANFDLTEIRTNLEHCTQLHSENERMLRTIQNLNDKVSQLTRR